MRQARLAGHADTIIDYVTTRNLDVEWLIETHVHADHYRQRLYPAKTGRQNRYF